MECRDDFFLGTLKSEGWRAMPAVHTAPGRPWYLGLAQGLGLVAEQAGGTSLGRVSLVPVEPHPSHSGATRLATVRAPGSPLTQVPVRFSSTSHLVLQELPGQDTLEPLE